MSDRQPGRGRRPQSSNGGDGGRSSGGGRPRGAGGGSPSSRGGGTGAPRGERSYGDKPSGGRRGGEGTGQRREGSSSDSSWGSGRSDDRRPTSGSWRGGDSSERPGRRPADRASVSRGRDSRDRDRDRDWKPRGDRPERPERSDNRDWKPRGYRPERSERGDRPDRGGRSDRGGSDRGGWGERGGRNDRGDQRREFSRDRGDRGDRAARQAERTEAQARYDGPEIPEHITGKELDRLVVAQLKGLPDKLALRVARHLAAAGELLEAAPQVAYEHTLAAKARAGRLALIREAVGEAAYAAGHFGEALNEFRAAKRMTGNNDYLPVIADCERALGRSVKALELAQSPAARALTGDARVEMVIVEAAARADLGEFDGALTTLENASLRNKSRADWVVRLRYAYADILVRAGRREAALEWFHRTAGIDGTGLTDAADRILELEGIALAETTLPEADDEVDADEADAEE